MAVVPCDRGRKMTGCLCCVFVWQWKWIILLQVPIQQLIANQHRSNSCAGRCSDFITIRRHFVGQGHTHIVRLSDEITTNCRTRKSPYPNLVILEIRRHYFRVVAIWVKLGTLCVYSGWAETKKTTARISVEKAGVNVCPFLDIFAWFQERIVRSKRENLYKINCGKKIRLR